VGPRILVDENVALAREAFGDLGDVELFAGRSLRAADVRDATALVVRSVTRVDERLLAGSAVRFVGTATIGTDHVDVDLLARGGIAFAYAPGSNARSVAEYVTAALLELEVERGRSWEGAVLGVVGVGHVGTLVVEQAAALGMEVLCCDPPRAEREGDAGFLPLARVLDAADAVTLHTPLAVAGRHATHHLIGARELARLRPGAVVLNTSRGPVADGAALLAALESGRLAAAVLDVWEGEPAPDLALVRRTSLATPHIAGYSLDGKVAGTRAIARALADFLGVPPPVGAALPRAGRVSIADTGRAALRSAVRSAYAIRDDDRRLRSAVVLEPRERAAAFDALRRDYPVRREFAAYEVETPGLADRDRARLARFGFALG